MINLSFFAFILSAVVFILSFFATKLAYNFIIKHKIWDDPKSNPFRKKQANPIPLLGGTMPALVAILAMAGLWLLNKFSTDFQSQLGLHLEPFRLYWVLTAVIILLIGGYFDDRFNMSPKFQVIPITLALLITIFLGGLKIEALSYPFDKIIPSIPFISEFITFCWLGFCVAATKFLDGHDGLVTSVGVISMFTIASVSLFNHVDQPLVFLFAIIWMAAFASFLPFNFPNAKMYLGEGGSEIVGFSIGFLSILSGAKIATASTVIGWFIIDLLLVWILRLIDKRNPLTSGDRLHWHFRLLDLGLTKIQVLVITTLILVVTAHIGLLFATQEKMWLLLSQFIWIAAVFGITFSVQKFKNKAKLKN